MKKLLNISFSFLLLIATTGVSVSSHICGGAVHDTAIFQEAEKCHPGEQNDMNGCCDDHNEYHQVDDDFQPSSQFGVDNLPALEYVVSAWFLTRNDLADHSFDFPHINSPPLANKGRYIIVLAQAFLL